MNTDSARDDLAFMRALVEPTDDWQKQFGETYSAAGLCYCVQMLLHGGQFFGLAPAGGPVALAIGLGPTVVFLGLLIWIIRRNRSGAAGGATSRAVGSVFGAVGATNLALVLVIGSVAWRWHSLGVWLIYPCVVMILQGLAWLVAYMLRRKSWLALVAIGWFATGFAMAIFIDNMGGFVVAAGVGMFAFMLLPGLFMLRQSRRSA
ncbi:hypothetical protein [Phenylobacterium sp.]|uniref:hypothetical protein n=1 Tax=Phenylobacterium sp. TaxID=1871053 RepID=UPI003563949E